MDAVSPPPSVPVSPIESNSPQKSLIRWNPILGVLYTIVIFFLSQIFAIIILQILYAGNGAIAGGNGSQAIDTSVTAQFLFTVFAELISIGAVIAFVRGYRVPLSAIGLRRPRPIDLLYGLSAVVPYYLLYVLTVGVVSNLVTGLNVNQEQQIGFNNVHGSVPMILTFISLAVLPPLAEEIMVRGFLYTSLKKALPIIPAVILTSAIFAAAHLPEGGAAGPLYIAALDTFVLSLVLIFLREKTGSLWAGITLHAIKNSVAFVALFVLHAR